MPVLAARPVVTALDRHEPLVDRDAAEQRLRAAGGRHQVADQRRQALLAGPDVARVLKLRPVLPGPILDDVQAAGRQQRKQGLEAGPRRRVQVGAVVDHQVELAAQVALHDLAQRPTVRLVGAPAGQHPPLQVPGPQPAAKVRAVLAVGQVDGDQPLGLQVLLPEGGAAAVPDADLQHAARPKGGRGPEAFELLDQLPVLVEVEAFAAELPGVVSRLLEAEDEVAQQRAVRQPGQALEHAAQPDLNRGSIGLERAQSGRTVTAVASR